MYSKNYEAQHYSVYEAKAILRIIYKQIIMPSFPFMKKKYLQLDPHKEDASLTKVPAKKRGYIMDAYDGLRGLRNTPQKSIVVPTRALEYDLENGIKRKVARDIDLVWCVKNMLHEVKHLEKAACQSPKL